MSSDSRRNFELGDSVDICKFKARSNIRKVTNMQKLLNKIEKVNKE